MILKYRAYPKKTQEFSDITRTAVSCKPCHKIANRFLPLKTEIHRQILNTEPFLCDFRQLRCLRNNIGFSSKQIDIHTGLQWHLQPPRSLRTPQLVFDRPLIDPNSP